MLYLRNTNQVQSLGKDIKRGVSNICCTPTLNSVTTASLTQLTVNVTFGTYLPNCKSCAGGYIEVSQNSGSTWTVINPGNCSPTNLVPMPSQSAYYRAFTSCSAVNQPFDPQKSDYSNVIFYVPNSRLNYKFVENNGAQANFKVIVTGSTVVDVSSSVDSVLWEIPSASAVTASITALSAPLTGSTSMSLLITGSNVSYFTSSCIYATGSVFIGNYKAIPNEDYYVTASISYRPENVCTASSYTDMGYLVTSYDETTGIWYHANEYGVPDISGLYPSASITGSATKISIVAGDCRQNAIQFSGSLTLRVDPGSSAFPFRKVYMGIVTGSFTLSGQSEGVGWSMTVRYQNTGSISVPNYTLNNATTKNAVVGLENTSFTAPGPTRAMSLYVSGSQIANNPPFWAGPSSLCTYITLSGVGIIRAFGYGYFGSPEGLGNQQQYNCIYDTTPSK